MESGMMAHFTFAIWGFPQIRGTILEVPVISTIVYWGLYWGTLILGNYHIKQEVEITTNIVEVCDAISYEKYGSRKQLGSLITP